MKYSGNITGGALLVRESRIIAQLLLEGHSQDEIRARVLTENLLQNSSAGTTRKYCGLILQRLRPLSPELLRLVADGTEELARLTLFAAVLRSIDLVADFVEDVLITKVGSFEPALKRTDWSQFLEERATIDPSIHDWSEGTRKKMSQIAFLMLAQAGYIESTRSLKILFPAIPNQLASALEAVGDDRTLRLLKLGRS